MARCGLKRDRSWYERLEVDEASGQTQEQPRRGKLARQTRQAQRLCVTGIGVAAKPTTKA